MAPGTADISINLPSFFQLDDGTPVSELAQSTYLLLTEPQARQTTGPTSSSLFGPLSLGPPAARNAPEQAESRANLAARAAVVRGAVV